MHMRVRKGFFKERTKLSGHEHFVAEGSIERSRAMFAVTSMKEAFATMR